MTSNLLLPSAEGPAPSWFDGESDGHPLNRSLRAYQRHVRVNDTFATVGADVETGLGHSQFFLLYQPRFSLQTHAVVALEALLRWRNPTRGLLAPNAFLPAVSQTRAIVPLGRWVLDEACREAARWEQQRPRQASPIVVSVNLTGREILEPGFVESTREIVGRHGVPFQLIQFEVDAGDPLRGDNRLALRLALLRNVGIRIAIDGASPTLGLGSEFISADSVHVHRRWVREVGRDADLTTALGALAERAHRSGAQLCAMGVEEERQDIALGTVGCDQAQGFLLGDPVEPDALGWLDDDT